MVHAWAVSEYGFFQNLQTDVTELKRYFVYSAVTQFDTRNTSSDTTPFGGAGSGVFGLVSFACGSPGSTPSVCPGSGVFGLVSFACGSPRFDSLGVSGVRGVRTVSGVRGVRTVSGVRGVRTGFLRMRKSPVRLPRCVHIIFKA
jgi:hypothetical protein